MSGDTIGLIGSVFAGLAALGVVIRSSRSSESVADRSAAASEVEALGRRLDAQAARGDEQDKKIADLQRQVRGLRDYIAEDHAEHRRNDWPITPLPEGLA